MPISADELFGKLLALDERAKSAARAEELAAQYLTLQQLRKARALTQAQLARRAGKDQVAVSHIEKRTDMLLSTLRTYVEAMGGSLNLVVQFDDRAPVFLTGLTDEEPVAGPRKALATAPPRTRT